MGTIKIVPIAIVIPLKIVGNEVFIWLQTRKSSDELNGLLEFPGGKIEAEETPLLAASRELLEETGAKVSGEDLALLKIYTHHYIGKQVNIYAYLLTSGKMDLFSQHGWHKLGPDWKTQYHAKIPAANLEILEDLYKNFA